MGSSDFSSLPTPPELFRQFETGQLSREELQATMALHARALIEEMEDERKNPKRSYLERLRNAAAIRRWTRKFSRREIREVLNALGEVRDFPPAVLLWNASHGDVPLHCFVRMRREPVFRIKELVVEPMNAVITVEYGKASRKESTRETFCFRRDENWRFSLIERRS